MKKHLVIAAVLCSLLALMVISFWGCAKKEVEIPVLKIGHVGHDHHTALYVAALNGERFKEDYGLYIKEIRPKALYEMYDGKKLIAELEFYKAGGGSKMPTAMAQGTFDVGFGGVAAVAFFVDKGTPMKIISPLHNKGDMLVAGNEFNADNWESFVKYVKQADAPVKVGFKAPKAIALLIFQAAMDEVGITYTMEEKDTKADVLLMNLKGASQLNPALRDGIIDAYVCNNPYCAIAEESNVGRCIADLDDLPPGLWKDHPCCMIAAMDEVVLKKRELVVKFLELMVIATDYINEDQEIAINSASQFLGTSIEVESKSIPTSGYSTEPDEKWLKGIYTWAKTMDELGDIKGALKGKSEEEINELLLDLSLIKEARENVAKRRQS